jgi:hypothetical protein
VVDVVQGFDFKELLEEEKSDEHIVFKYSELPSVI